jgi:hypothetical protein
MDESALVRMFTKAKPPVGPAHSMHRASLMDTLQNAYRATPVQRAVISFMSHALTASANSDEVEKPLYRPAPLTSQFPAPMGNKHYGTTNVARLILNAGVAAKTVSFPLPPSRDYHVVSASSNLGDKDGVVLPIANPGGAALSMHRSTAMSALDTLAAVTDPSKWSEAFSAVGVSIPLEKITAAAELVSTVSAGIGLEKVNAMEQLAFSVNADLFAHEALLTVPTDSTATDSKRVTTRLSAIINLYEDFRADRRVAQPHSSAPPSFEVLWDKHSQRVAPYVAAIHDHKFDALVNPTLTLRNSAPRLEPTFEPRSQSSSSTLNNSSRQGYSSAPRSKYHTSSSSSNEKGRNSSSEICGLYNSALKDACVSTRVTCIRRHECSFCDASATCKRDRKHPASSCTCCKKVYSEELRFGASYPPFSQLYTIATESDDSIPSAVPLSCPVMLPYGPASTCVPDAPSPRLCRRSPKGS